MVRSFHRRNLKVASRRKETKRKLEWMFLQSCLYPRLPDTPTNKEELSCLVREIV